MIEHYTNFDDALDASYEALEDAIKYTTNKETKAEITKMMNIIFNMVGD